MARPLLIADPENATIEASHSDSATYQAFLDEADKSISFQRNPHSSAIFFLINYLGLTLRHFPVNTSPRAMSYELIY